MMDWVNQYSYVTLSVCCIQTWALSLKRTRMKIVLIWLKLKTLMNIAERNSAKDIRQLHDET